MAKNSYWDPNRLIALKDKCGFARDVIAKGTELSSAAIYQYERGTTVPGMEAIVRLSGFFNVPTDYFLGMMSEEDEKTLLGDFWQNFSNYRRKIFEEQCRHRPSYRNAIAVRESAIAPWPYNLIDDIFGSRKQTLTDAPAYPLTQDQEDGLAKVLEDLTERERSMIFAYYRDNKTLEQIAVEYDLTRNRVHQIIVHGIRKMMYFARSVYIAHGIRGCGLMQREKRLEQRERELDRWERKLNIKERIIGSQSRPEENHQRTAASILIEDLELSVRSYNCLKRASLNTVEAVLRSFKDDAILRVRNLGKKSVAEIIEHLCRLGFPPQADITRKWGSSFAEEITDPNTGAMIWQISENWAPYGLKITQTGEFYIEED